MSAIASLRQALIDGAVPFTAAVPTLAHVRRLSEAEAAAYLAAHAGAPTAQAPEPAAPAPASAADDPASALIAAIRSVAATVAPPPPPLDPDAVVRIAREAAADVVAAHISRAVVAVQWHGRDQTKPGTPAPSAQHREFPRLCRVVGAISPHQVLLVGPSGTGKTHAAHALAESLDIPYRSHGACLMPHDLLGFVDAGGTYRPTAFVETYRTGGVVVLDELDSWSERASLALCEALANGSMSLPSGERVTRHPDCIIVACGNTWGRGATGDYTGRTRLDAALLARFPVQLAWDFDPDLEAAIAGRHGHELAAVCRASLLDRGHVEYANRITMRHAVAAGQLLASGMPMSEVVTLVFRRGLPDTVAAALDAHRG